MINLNKIFPWLSIRNKLLIAFAGLSILPLTFVGVYSILTNIRMMRSIALGELTEDVQTIREKSENFLDDVYSDLRVLENSMFVSSWIHGAPNFRTESAKTNLDRVARELLAFAKTKDTYYQFRLINNDGDEMVRIECPNPDDLHRTYRIVPDSELRHARETYYFLLINTIAKDQIAFAPAELQGVDSLRIPVMSFAVPLEVGEHVVGILVANVFEKKLIEAIQTRNVSPRTRKVVLTTGDGHYLYRSDMQKDWNRLLAARGEDNVRLDYPQAVSDSILSGRDGAAVEGLNDIISYAPLFGSETRVRGVRTPSSFAVPVIIFESESADVILGPVRAYAVTYLGFLGLFLLSAVGLGLIATRQITRPIAELQRGAEVIAHGNYANTLKVETHDEIEKLADQFNTMAESLRVHETEIERHRTRLEDMVSQRTHELQEEKSKLQAVLDNVPSAFVLLDKLFRIQTVSAAFSNVTGLAPGDVQGNGRFHLPGDPDGYLESPWERAAMKGVIESYVQKIDGLSADGRFLEYIAIPMKQEGEISAVLVIITDITKRKQLEKQLVHAEKLTAAGEMSSIIAHEFRNALTSVKMILQLFVESQKATRTEKKSLAVALDSIYHMEMVVTELLNFARPKPVQLAMTDLNKIVQESIEFVGPHIQQNNIVVVAAFDRTISPRPLDGSRLKEAIINLLLNAIQAFEVHDSGIKKRSIEISTKRIQLVKTIRDVVYAESVPEPRNPNGDSEVVLEERAVCSLLEIHDNGGGIGKNDLPRIFDPFFTTKTNGTGLGLPMVKRAVTAHGGVVTVESKEGEGTTFKIYIPAAYAE